MDILTHTISGLAVGTVMAGFSSTGWKNKTAIISFSGLGGALPDIDAVSMWSRFDATFGKFFGLQETGKVIYSAKYWYSHHGFMHSLFAAIFIAGIIGMLLWLLPMIKNKNNTLLLQTFQKNKLLLAGFVFGFVIHLLQDMITPASSWGGVRFFFPSTVYIGGTGDIWWWNNYNLFLVVVSVLLINICLLVILCWKKIKVWKYTTAVFLVGCILFAVQLKRINYNFNGRKYLDCEQKSKDIQKDILGEKIYYWMVKLDNSLKVYF